jgi:hypothetical protein
MSRYRAAPTPKVQSRKIGRRRLIVVRSLLEALEIDPDTTPLGELTLCTISTACHATGLGKTSIWNLLEDANAAG